MTARNPINPINRSQVLKLIQAGLARIARFEPESAMFVLDDRVDYSSGEHVRVSRSDLLPLPSDEDSRAFLQGSCLVACKFDRGSGRYPSRRPSPGAARDGAPARSRRPRPERKRLSRTKAAPSDRLGMVRVVAYSRLVLRAVSEAGVPELLAAGSSSAVALERLARAAGATNWTS